jgi:predicted phosphodiesterase
MKVAALYDIHGNLPALEAVLRDVRREGVDRVVAGGDVVIGPMSREAVAMLLALDVPVDCIQGNCEVAVLAEMAGRVPAVPESVRETVRWTAAQLHPDWEPVIASWPMTVRVTIAGIGEVLFCHATPRNENECFTRRTPDARLRPVFDPANVAAVVCGHTHMQFDRMVGRTRVVNAGSVGMPFGEPGADWLLLGPGVELRHTDYDLEAASERIRATTYPQAAEFAERYVRHPPSAASMLDVFAKAELA